MIRSIAARDSRNTSVVAPFLRVGRTTVRVALTGLRFAVGWHRGARGSQLEAANGPASV
jgi:hypothetical protein